MWAAGMHAENGLSAGGGVGGQAVRGPQPAQLSPGHHRHLQTGGLSLLKTPGWTRNPPEPD